MILNERRRWCGHCMCENKAIKQIARQVNIIVKPNGTQNARTPKSDFIIFMARVSKNDNFAGVHFFLLLAFCVWFPLFCPLNFIHFIPLAGGSWWWWFVWFDERADAWTYRVYYTVTPINLAPVISINSSTILFAQHNGVWIVCPSKYMQQHSDDGNNTMLCFAMRSTHTPHIYKH